MRDVRWHKVELAVSLGATLLLLLLAVAGPALQGWPGVATFVATLLMIVQPPALVRLLDRFRPVIPRELWTAVGGAALGLVGLIVLPYPRPVAFPIALALFFGGVQGYAAWAVFTEAQRRAGITRHRLIVASVGMALGTLLVLIEGFSWITGARPPVTVHLMLTLATGACYYLGLAPPARLLRSLQEREFVRLLRRTAERAPESREDTIADDLHEAVTRAIASAATAVLLGRDDLSVYASSEPAWEGARVKPEVGLIGVAMNGTSPVVGTPDECERPLDQCAAGEVVAVIPIARSTPGWGVLLLVQRRASIYASHDMDLAGTFCRHAADVLDHARLMHDEERRRERPSPNHAALLSQ